MRPHSTLDRESFQRFLASAFAVQESRVSTHSLSGIIEIQRLITAGGLDLDVAVQLIATHTRNVANASGVAIGFLQGHHLVYRVGIGSAASHAEKQVTATLGISADGSGREILRVENAQTDARIEAAICRQFGAKSLLMMPICQGRTVMGVLEVLFSEPHAFQEGEVRTYRLMAGLIGEARARTNHAEQGSAAQQSVAQTTTVLQTFPQHSSVPEPINRRLFSFNKDTMRRLCKPALALGSKLPALRNIAEAAKIKQRLNRVPLPILKWSVAAAALALFVAVGWSTHGRRQVSSAQRMAVGINQPANSGSALPAGANLAASTSPRAGHVKKAVKSAFKRVQVGENEVDYVSNDVTIRHFTPHPASHPLRAYNQVEFGKDVTVRLFAPASRPVASSAQPVSHTLPEAEKSVHPKLAR